MICSLILARGGSKGIPGKNIIDLNGKPLIAYSIEASLASGVDETWVSTDDPEIAMASREYGAKVIDRPSELAQDTSKSEGALNHFADNKEFDSMVFIQPTSPMIQPGDIDEALQMVRPNGKYDSVFTVTEEHWIPRWRLPQPIKGLPGALTAIEPIDWDIYKRPRRQDKSPTYIENGMFYVTTSEQLRKTKVRYGGRIGVVKIPLHRSFQIDSLEDLELIRRIMK